MKKFIKLLSIPVGLLTLASCSISVNVNNTSVPSTSSSDTSTVASASTSTGTLDLSTTPVEPSTTTTSSTTSSTSTTTISKDDIKIEIESIDTVEGQGDSQIPVIEFTGNQINIPINVPEDCTAVIKYKAKGASDSEYTTTPPKDMGDYEIQIEVQTPNSTTPIVINQEIKVYSDILGEYKQYKNTDAYKKVSTPKEFLDALYDAKYIYTTTATEILKSEGYVVRNNVRKAANWPGAVQKGLYLKNSDNTYTKIPSDTPWDPDDPVYTSSLTYYEDSPYTKVAYTQEASKLATVKVIEITEDLDLGYNLIKDLGANTATFENWDKNKALESTTKFYKDPEIKASGISKIKVENMTDLLIFSKNGSKLTHCGFNVVSSKDISFRNLEMDEIWMWEDSTTTDLSKIGDYDAAPWAYFKINHSENIWIDHCTFGKSFDGQIDYANPVYDSVGTLYRAPYGGTGANGLKVTYCDFKAGSDDPDGYLYKMMEKIEAEYQVYLADKTNYVPSEKTCRYYFNKRDSGLSFEDILYGYAIPQKKAFLWGDSGDPYVYNKYLVATLANCTIKNIEDRLPKVRGGMAYVYNVLVDNTEYYPYALSLGNVSQGILAGLDASIYLESVEYKGIKNYLKNNDSSNSEYPTVNGGYMIKNSKIGNIYGSTTNTDPFSSLNSSASTLSIGNFAFKVNGEKTTLTEPPFEIDAYDLKKTNSLENYFKDYPTGTFSY